MNSHIPKVKSKLFASVVCIAVQFEVRQFPNRCCSVALLAHWDKSRVSSAIRYIACALYVMTQASVMLAWYIFSLREVQFNLIQISCSVWYIFLLCFSGTCSPVLTFHASFVFSVQLPSVSSLGCHSVSSIVLQVMKAFILKERWDGCNCT